MKFLLIGGHSFLGLHLLEEIKHFLPDVDVYISTSRKNLAGGNIIYVDYESFGSVEALLRYTSPDYILHLASYTLQDCSDLALSKGQIRDDNILRGLSKLDNIPKLIFISSMAVFSPNNKNVRPYFYQPVSNYGFEKLYMINKLLNFKVRQKNFEYKIIYPSSIYGKGQKGKMFLPTLLNYIKKREVMIANGAHKSRDFIHVSDVSKALIQLITNYEKIIEKHVFVHSLNLYKLYEIADLVCGIVQLDSRNVIQFKDSEKDIREHKCEFQNIARDCFKYKFVSQVPIREGLKEMFEETFRDI